MRDEQIVWANTPQIVNMSLSKAEYRTLFCSLDLVLGYDPSGMLCNFISFDVEAKRKIMEESHLSKSSVESAISSLTRKGIFIKYNKIRGCYYLNPILYYRGEFKDRMKAINNLIDLGLLKNG